MSPIVRPLPMHARSTPRNHASRHWWPPGDVVYHLIVADGAATFGAGAAPDEDVRMEQSWDTAVAVATGTMNTQELLIGGKISVTGDLQKLIACQAVFVALDAVFETVRQETVYE